MNMFEEIEKTKKELPKMKTIQEEVVRIDFNIYQQLSIILFIICIFLGILFGNLFPVCGSSSALYGGACLTTNFNTALMLLIWFISFIICLFIFMLGHVILLLTDIRDRK